MAAGIGLIAFIAGIQEEGERVHLVGLIPLLVGGVVFGCAQFMSPRS
jgi:hypothetical protein